MESEEEAEVVETEHGPRRCSKPLELQPGKPGRELRCIHHRSIVRFARMCYQLLSVNTWWVVLGRVRTVRYSRETLKGEDNGYGK